MSTVAIITQEMLINLNVSSFTHEGDNYTIIEEPMNVSSELGNGTEIEDSGSTYTMLGHIPKTTSGGDIGIMTSTDQTMVMQNEENNIIKVSLK